MSIRVALCLYGAVAALLLSVASASAQYRPRPIDEVPPAEMYQIEGSFGLWKPGPRMSITSESLGIVGSTIDFGRDLGLSSTRFPEFRVVFHPGRKHKLRFQYIPIDYNQTAILTREIVFNGQRYIVGLPINSELDWKAYRFTYEYDFISARRGFGGLLLDVKQTHIRATLSTPLPQLDEFTDRSAPVPSIGGIARVYIVPSVSITGELSGIRIPRNNNYDFSGHYAELTISGVVNFNRHLGAELGYRSFDVDAIIDRDSGSFTVKGWYFGGVVRY